MGVGVSIAAVALGASVIEKHFTLARADGGVDRAFSLELQELAAMVHECERARYALGEVRYWPTEAEKKSLVFWRSLFVCSDIKAGDQLSDNNVRIVRPGLGLSPDHFEAILDTCVNLDVVCGSALTWDLLK